MTPWGKGSLQKSVYRETGGGGRRQISLDLIRFATSEREKRKKRKKGGKVHSENCGLN